MIITFFMLILFVIDIFYPLGEPSLKVGWEGGCFVAKDLRWTTTASSFAPRIH